MSQTGSALSLEGFRVPDLKTNDAVSIAGQVLGSVNREASTRMLLVIAGNAITGEVGESIIASRPAEDVA